MINAEKYRDEILAKVDKTERFAIETNNQNVLRNCIDLECSECLFNEGTGLCYFERMKWLLSEYKEHVKLTRLEYLLLKLFYEKDFRYLTRGVRGYLYINKGNNPPQKKDVMWLSNETYISFDLIDDLFQFVQWSDEEPTSIEEVLKNCVVEED